MGNNMNDKQKELLKKFNQNEWKLKKRLYELRKMFNSFDEFEITMKEMGVPYEQHITR